jgi:hypothetical protein
MEKQSLKVYQIEILKYEYFISLPIIAVLFFVEKSLSVGLLWGVCFSIIDFNLKLMGLKKMEQHKFSRGSGFVNYIFRYVLLGTSMFLSLKFESINIVATMVGIFSINLLILARTILKKDLGQNT